MPRFLSEGSIEKFAHDRDGQNNQTEWTAGTDLFSSTSRFAATPVRNGENLEITVPTAPGRTYTLLQSDTLQGGTWTAVPGITNPISGDGDPHTFQVPIGSEKMFFQVRVSMP